MSAAMPPSMRHAIQWESWALTLEADRRFRIIAAVSGAVILLLGILFSLMHFEGKQRGGGVYNGNRYVELLPEKEAEVAPQAEEPKPAKEDSKTPPQQAAPVKNETRPVDKPVKPVPDKTETAREVAEKSGILALKNQLSDLRDPKLNALDNGQPLINGTLNSKGGTMASATGNPDSVSASAAAASGGIGGTGTGNITSTQSGVGVGNRRTSTVQSPLGFGQDKSHAGDAGKSPSGNRNSQEIQIVFDRNQGAFYSIFNKAQRENPDLGVGTIKLNLTIAPNGSVTQCHIVSSPFHDPDLEHKIVERVKLMNFGAKSVPPYTLDYPLHYQPS